MLQILYVILSVFYKKIVQLLKLIWNSWKLLAYAIFFFFKTISVALTSLYLYEFFLLIFLFPYFCWHRRKTLIIMYDFLKVSFLRWFYKNENSRDILFVLWLVFYSIFSVIIYFLFSNYIWMFGCFMCVVIFQLKYEKSYRRGNLGTPRTILLWSIYLSFIWWFVCSYFFGTFWI